MEELSVLLSQLSCGNDEQAEEALPHLALWGADAVGALTERLSHPEAEVRWWAVRALAEVQDERVPALLVRALSDQDESVRWCAGLALRIHPSSQASSALVEMLTDRDALTRRLAGDALVAIGREVVPILIEVVERSVPEMRLEIIRALAKIGDQRAIPVLFEALDDGSALIEYWADEGLEKMGVGMVYFNPE
jgi:HEAT repeat protein